MSCRSKNMLLAATMLVFAFTAGVAEAQSAASPIWFDASPAAIATTGERLITPDRYRTVAVDREALGAFLASVPLEDTPAAAERAILELPLPDGTSGRFSIVESSIMAPELAAKYPQIRTYAGYGVDDPTARVRLDLTPAGFHAQILRAGGSIYLDPLQRGDFTHYQSYYRRDFTSDDTLGGCTVVDEDGMADEIDRLVAGGAGIASGTQLRTYRAAVATTGEYTAFFGGTVAQGLAAVVTSMNRVVGVYEREVSVSMELVANNDDIIYTDAATDPYTNGDGGAMLGQNQANLDAVIGSANYDIGHVFSTGGGGVAGLSVVCRAGLKARGVTGRFNPSGDPFDIDYVAHEMGHQFGGNHSFNGTAGACSGQRVASAAYEPGSGSTIMAYAGICSFHNLQPHSDDYFVFVSLREIVRYTTIGSGATCPVVTPTGAIEPAVEAGTGGFTIPLSTPFTLTASATTAGAPTYCWEESDLGAAGHPSSPVGNAPTFRSFDPVSGTTRTFPKLTDLVNGTLTIGERLPTYARNLTFKCTVRDFQAGGVGVRDDSISFAVAAVGPFLVTSPDAEGISWGAGTVQTVTWNVAGTTAAPISCPSVNIRLSTDGGFTFPILVLAGTPNDGTQSVTVPDTTTSLARIKVEAANNIFFDISNENFTISPRTDVAVSAPVASGFAMSANHPNPFRQETAIIFAMPRADDIALRVYDTAGRLVRTLAEGRIEAGRHEVSWNGTDAAGKPVSPGVYFYRLTTAAETLTGRMALIR